LIGVIGAVVLIVKAAKRGLHSKNPLLKILGILVLIAAIVGILFIAGITLLFILLANSGGIG